MNSAHNVLTIATRTAVTGACLDTFGVHTVDGRPAYAGSLITDGNIVGVFESMKFEVSTYTDDHGEEKSYWTPIAINIDWR